MVLLGLSHRPAALAKIGGASHRSLASFRSRFGTEVGGGRRWSKPMLRAAGAVARMLSASLPGDRYDSEVTSNRRMERAWKRSFDPRKQATLFTFFVFVLLSGTYSLA